MNTIEVEGGWSNEAIEIGFWHANKENERENIIQVILIDDAPPNSKNEVANKRENYWKNTKFAQDTYYEDELAKLTSNSIPVHAYSPLGSQILTDLVTEEILRNVGGSSKRKGSCRSIQEKIRKDL